MDILQCPTISPCTTPAQEQPTKNRERATHLTSEIGNDITLLKIKVAASSITRKLQAIKRIKDGWDKREEEREEQQEEEFALFRLEVELLIEYAMEVSEEIVVMTKQLLITPPAYNDEPDEERYQHLEVLVLSAYLIDYIVDLQDKLGELTQQVNDTKETMVQEVCLRLSQTHREARDIINTAKKLCSDQDTR